MQIATETEMFKEADLAAGRTFAYCFHPMLPWQIQIERGGVLGACCLLLACLTLLGNVRGKQKISCGSRSRYV
jgi:hypothetical protein